MKCTSLKSLLLCCIAAPASSAHNQSPTNARPKDPTDISTSGVTLTIAPHAAREWHSSSGHAKSIEALFNASCSKDAEISKRIIQSSFIDSFFEQNHIDPSTNGFVWAAVQAYSTHHHLILRPEDIWFAILSQLNFYINAHAEDLRHLFVSHEGRKHLKLTEVGTMAFVDFGLLAHQMTSLIQENVKDPSLRDWILPSWSTTTDEDTAVASILMMGTLQKYFSYEFALICGIPSVTLLGQQSDWKDILSRLDQIDTFGSEAAVFASLLRPILKYFVASFDPSPDESIQSFWQKIAHESGGCGPIYLSGWITAFAFWDENGKSLYHRAGENGPERPVSHEIFRGRNAGCEIDGVLYHRVDTKDIPAGFASVPVTVNDNGEVYQTKMLAGSLGIRISSSGRMLDPGYGHADEQSFEVVDGKSVEVNHVVGEATKGPGLDTLQPLSGWVMYEVKSEAEIKAMRWRDEL